MINYLSVENASKSFGELILFDRITFGVDEGQKVALIARNGAGKTTLLNIFAGRDSFDSGTYYINKDIKTGYLAQDPQFDPSLTLFQAVFGASGVLMEAVRNYELALHHHDTKKLEDATAQMDFHKAWDFDARINQMLGILKLNDEEQRVGELSGGQVKRLALAVALINEPQFIILDEPTNHLDIDMIEWLEETLLKSQITLLMVTHDRYFLDRICDVIIEIDEKTMYAYTGNYSAYLQKRAERLQNKAQMAEKARNLMRTELEWMRRMPKARTTKAKYRIDAFYDLKKQSEYRRRDDRVEINVKTSRLGKKILQLENISKKFGETVIFDRFSYAFTRGEKLGIIGRNGVGKTTFLNLITGGTAPDSGTMEPGETVVYGYYQQQGLEFKPGRRVIDILRDIAEVVTLGDGRQVSVSQFLNYFLFPPEMQYVQVEKLSGGEKRRLYLMTVLMRNPNFLILDEPTNDFDIVTLNVLEDYLLNFGGCLILVSHDRFFMDKLVDHLFIFEGDGAVYDFPGNYSDYRASQKMQVIEARRSENRSRPSTGTTSSASAISSSGTSTTATSAATTSAATSAATTSAATSAATSAGAFSAPDKTKKKKPGFKEKREFEQLTAEIDTLEKEKTSIENQLSSGSLKPDELLSQSKRIQEIMALLDQKTDRWLELSELLK